MGMRQGVCCQRKHVSKSCSRRASGVHEHGQGPGALEERKRGCRSAFPGGIIKDFALILTRVGRL